MKRDFIFDSNGLVIGYRCRVEVCEDGPKNKQYIPCPCRPFNTARGLWQHQARAHGLYQQLQLISTPETANLGRKKKKDGR